MPDKLIKNLKGPLRQVIRPALWLSIGLHVIVLLAPLPAPPKPDEAAQDPEEIKVTRLPAQPSPTVTPPARQQPKPPQLTQPNRPINRPISRPSAARPPVEPARSQPALTETQPAQPPDSTQPDPAPSEPPAANLQISFADFPDLAGAQGGCFDSSQCRQISGTPFRDAAQTLQQQMESQGYQVTPRDDLEDTGQKIYQLVALDGATRYLSVLSSDVGSTVYLLASEPLTIADLQQVGSIQTRLETLLSQVGSEAIAAQVPYPTLFFAGANPRPEINQLRVVPNVSPKQMATTLTNKLKMDEFSLSEIGDYGGGTMYEIGKKAFTGYVNLVPTTDGKGTVIVSWKSLPT